MDGGVDVGVWTDHGHFRYRGRERVRIRVDEWEFDVFRRLVRVRGVGEYLPIFVHRKIFGGVVPSDWTREDGFGVFVWVICFNAPITSKNIAGCALAVVGMIYYTQAMNKQKEDEAKGVQGMIHSGSSSASLSAKV